MIASVFILGESPKPLLFPQCKSKGQLVMLSQLPVTCMNLVLHRPSLCGFESFVLCVGGG